jgi:hypothetical protein
VDNSLCKTLRIGRKTDCRMKEYVWISPKFCSLVSEINLPFPYVIHASSFLIYRAVWISTCDGPYYVTFYRLSYLPHFGATDSSQYPVHRRHQSVSCTSITNDGSWPHSTSKRYSRRGDTAVNGNKHSSTSFRISLYDWTLLHQCTGIHSWPLQQ